MRTLLFGMILYSVWYDFVSILQNMHKVIIVIIKFGVLPVIVMVLVVRMQVSEYCQVVLAV